MIRRLLPLLLGLGLGLAALTAALVALAGTFSAERADAERAIAEQRNALESYASASLQRRLDDALAAARARLPAALADPLAPAADLLLLGPAGARLPRSAAPAPAAPTVAAAYAQLLASPLAEGPSPAPAGPWAERQRLLGALRARLATGDPAAAASAARALLAHLAQHRLRVDRDLASALALVDRFAAEGRPSAALLEALLRDGLTVDDGVRVAPLQRALLDARPRLEALDFALAAARVRALSLAAGVRCDDFEREVLRPPAPPVQVPPALAAPALVSGGAWLVAPDRPGGSVGVAVDLPALVAAVGAEMRASELLSASDALLAPPLAAGAAAPLPLALRVDAPRFAAASVAAAAREAHKVLLLAGAGALALLLAGLTVALQLAGARFLTLRAQLLAAVSHELKTPLASIALFAETLTRRLGGRPEARDYPARIARDAHGLAALVERLLTFHRLERGHPRPRPARLRAAALLDAAADAARARATRPVEIAIDAPEGLALRADPTLAGLLVSNLLDNAVAYGRIEPVRVRLTAAAHGRRVVLGVHDNGPGIPPEERARVFSEFVRGSSAVGRRGSGLGLAICRRVARLCGGRVCLAASGPAGSSFEVTLPAAPASPAHGGER